MLAVAADSKRQHVAQRVAQVAPLMSLISPFLLFLLFTDHFNRTAVFVRVCTNDIFLSKWPLAQTFGIVVHLENI